MKETAPQFAKSESSLTTQELARYISDWLNDSHLRSLSPLMFTFRPAQPELFIDANT